MIYELLTYDAAPGRLIDLHNRFKNHTLRIFKKHGFNPIAFFTPEIGGFSNQLLYILAFDNLEKRKQCWENFKADPEWQKIKEQSEMNVPLIIRTHNIILQPTDYSPLK